MKRFLFATFLVAAVAFAQEFKLGSTVGEFTVTDVKGNTQSYSALKGDTTVVIFVATQCPVSNAYNERMNAVYKDYSAKGVNFVFINANNTEPAAEVEQHAKSHALLFPVYKDQGNVVADRFGAQVTPEAFVMDRNGVMRYHGHIDDSQAEARVKSQNLRKALDAMLEGQPVPAAETKAFGCAIKRKKSVS